MSDQLENAKPLTPVELLDVALFRELNSEEIRKPEAIVDTLSTLLGTWLLTHSEAPEMDAVTLLCKARGYISRIKLEAALHRSLQPKCTEMGGD
jgi:hypothetical protein